VCLVKTEYVQNDSRVVCLGTEYVERDERIDYYYPLFQ
jgi:hypothetical protein